MLTPRGLLSTPERGSFANQYALAVAFLLENEASRSCPARPRSAKGSAKFSYFNANHNEGPAVVCMFEKLKSGRLFFYFLIFAPFFLLLDHEKKKPLVRAHDEVRRLEGRWEEQPVAEWQRGARRQRSRGGPGRLGPH